MGRKTVLQSSFNAGAMSPRLWGRTDYKKYSNACRTLSNTIPLATGAATFRPGSLYQGASLKGATKKSRLVRFKYNVSQTYQLEFSDYKLRFWRNRAVVLSSTAFTNGDFASSLTGWTQNDTAPGTSAQAGGKAVLTGNGGAGYGRIYQKLSYVGVNLYTITLDVGVGSISYQIGTTAGASDIATGSVTTGTGKTITFTPSVAGDVYVQLSNNGAYAATVDNVVLNTPEYWVDTPYAEADLPSLSFTQELDTMVIAFGSMTVKTRVLQRYGHANWVFSTLTTYDGPYLATNTDTTKTLTPSGLTGAITITATGHSPFAATDVGRLVRIGHSVSSVVTWGNATITGYTSPTQVSATVNTAFNGTTAVYSWRLGAFSDTTGYPAKTTMHEGRVVFAATPTLQNWVWFSESQGLGGNRALFAPSEISGAVSDSNSIYFPLSAGDSPKIIWLSSGNSLAVGTSDSEWIIERGDSSKALSPSNSRASRRTNHGSVDNTNAVRIDGAVIYAKGIGTKINRFQFNFNADDYESIDVSLIGEHLFPGKRVVDIVYQPEPYNLVWVLLDDGTLTSLTYISSQEVAGWASHNFGGFVEGISTGPSDDGTYTELWMIVRRTINGNTVRYIEVMAPPYFIVNRTTACYVDCALQYSGAPVTSVSGLSHLEGETVAVYADSCQEALKTVTGGTITLDDASSTVTVGIPYDGLLETLNFEVANTWSTSSIGQIRDISEVFLQLHDTGVVYAKRGDQDDSEYALLEPRTSEDLMDTAPALKNGLYEVQAAQSWERDSYISIKMQSPLPATICAMSMKVQVNEG
jgi:hypothetical protein